MLHCDAETLALVALGEPLADDERRHLAHCARCQAELDQNRAVVAVGRTVTHADAPQDPDPVLWDGIASELGLDPAVTPFVPGRGEAEERAQVVTLAHYRHRERRTRRVLTWVAAAAAAAGIALGALGASVIGGPQGTDPGTLVAQSQLRAVPVDAGGATAVSGDLSGTTRIVDADGQDYAEVDARGLPAVDGYYEVWLIKQDLSGMISLGALTAGSQGRFTIPLGTDLESFTIVDVSLEPFNGDPTHSKQSVLRGTLQV